MNNFMNLLIAWAKLLVLNNLCYFADTHCHWAIFCFRVMGAAALQKYIGSLGGIGASGVGSSSSYSPKEINKDIMPEKVRDYT